jgi:chaperonin GroES
MAPLGDRVLVRPRVADTKSAGGVLLSTGATTELADAVVGTVVAVGEGSDIAVKEGDTVLFIKYSSSDVKTAEGDVCFVSQKSVLAKLE